MFPSKTFTEIPVIILFSLCLLLFKFLSKKQHVYVKLQSLWIKIWVQVMSPIKESELTEFFGVSNEMSL